jgi:hypothetical protein
MLRRKRRKKGPSHPISDDQGQVKGRPIAGRLTIIAGPEVWGRKRVTVAVVRGNAVMKIVEAII